MLTHALAGIGLLIGTATDIDHREVPDWVNYGMVLAGLGIASMSGLSQASYQPILASILGVIVGYLLGALMYYTGQWGGGDAKMLMGLGSLLGVPASFFTGAAPTPLFMYFLIAVVFAGAAYGITWMAILGVKKRQILIPAIKKKLRTTQMKRTRKIIQITTLIILIAALALQNIITLALLIIAAISVLTFYLSIAAKTIEEKCFVKKQPIDKLVLGDWILKEVKVKDKVIIPASNTGLTPKQLKELKKHDIKHVTIKEGIPFVPSFLIGYAAAYAWYTSGIGVFFWV